MPAKGRRSTPPDRRPTADHIMPRCRGGSSVFGRDPPGWPPLRNLRVVCCRCNEARGQVCHCPAVVACALAVMGRDASVSRIVWWHRYGRVAGNRWRELLIRCREAAPAPGLR